MVRWSIAYVLAAIAALASCLRGPGFMQQQGQMPRSGGLQAWVHALEPASVDGGRFKLQTGAISMTAAEE
jgi:hypothetical protein